MLAIITYLINPDLMEWSSIPVPYLSVGLESAWTFGGFAACRTFHTLGPKPHGHRRNPQGAHAGHERTLPLGCDIPFTSRDPGGIDLLLAAATGSSLLPVAWLSCYWPFAHEKKSKTSSPGSVRIIEYI